MSNQKIETAVVLAGGQGLRLRPLTNDCPKPMVRVLDRPLLEWILNWLKHNGIKKVVVGVAYKKESVIDYFGNGSKFGLDIRYSAHSVEGETAEGFKLAIQRHIDKEDAFLAMNGDEITGLDISDLANFHFKTDALATIVTSYLQCPYGVVKVNRDNVMGFVEKPTIKSVLVNTGIYLFNKEVMQYIPEKGAIERETFPLLCKMGRLKAYKLDRYWITIDTLKDLKDAENILLEKEKSVNV